MKPPLARMSLILAGLVTAALGPAASAIAELGSNPPQDYTGLLTSSTVLDALEPELREGIVSIALLATRYMTLSDSDFNKLRKITSGRNSTFRTAVVAEADGSQTEITAGPSRSLSVKFTRPDKSVVMAELSGSTLPADEAYLLALPGHVTRRYSPDKRWLFVEIEESGDAQTTYSYNRQEPRLSWTKVKHRASGRGTTIGCYRLEADERTLQSGELRTPDGAGLLTVQWREYLGLPMYAVLSKAGEAQGRVITWDTVGKKITDCKVPNGGEAPGMIRVAAASMNTNQLDALNLSARTRLRLSPAFRRGMTETQMLVEDYPGMRQSMASLAEWSDRFHHLTPGDIAYLYYWGEAKVVQTKNNEGTVYRLMTNEPDGDWYFIFDATTGKLKGARWYILALYFDYHNDSQFVGGRAIPDGSQWLISVYPEKVWPRIAVESTKSPSPDCLAKGKVYLWGPAGEVYIEQDITEPTPVSALVKKIDHTLSAEQKASMGWRGDKEADFLLGTY